MNAQSKSINKYEMKLSVIVLEKMTQKILT